MTQPIRPEEAAARKLAVLPGEVIEVFNELIAAAFDGRSATVSQDDAETAISGRLGITRAEVVRRHLLDVESVYQAADWEVTYDKPGWNETYRAFFVFTRPGGRQA